MLSIVTQVVKYLAVLLIAVYTLRCFTVFNVKSEQRQRKIYIGQNVIDTEYKEAFSHYVAQKYRNFVFLDVKGISYNEKLDAIIETLGLKMSRRELERYIAQNIRLQSKFDCVIHLLGLHEGYRLYDLKKRLSHSPSC